MCYPAMTAIRWPWMADLKGYITRHYGDPGDNIHAFQLELSTATYMEEEPPVAWREDLADQVRPNLIAMLEVAANWQPV